MKVKELTQDTNNPLFWALREVYANAKIKEASLDREIEVKKRELARLQSQHESAIARRDAVSDHAKNLGWTLVMNWEQ